MGVLAHTPAAEAPLGQSSNLHNPPSIGYHQTITNGVCIFFVTLFVGLRIYTRLRLVKSVGWDDYLILLAACIFFVDVGLFQHMVTLGLGKHLWNVSKADFAPYFLATWTFAAMIYSITMLCIKTSILMLYRRLFPISNFQYLWWLCMFCTVGYGLGAIFSSLFACVPVRANWDMTVKSNHCINKQAFYIGNGVMNIITDLMILALPIPVIWRLALELRQKVILSIIFTLGSISCVISLVRLLSIVAWIHVGDKDITYTLQNIVLWSTIELAICIICANVPCLRPFFERHLHFLLSIISSHAGESSHSSLHKHPTTIGRKRSRDISRIFDGVEMTGIGGGDGGANKLTRNQTVVSVATAGAGEDEARASLVLGKGSVGGESHGDDREREDREGEIVVHMTYRVQTIRESV